MYIYEKDAEKLLARSIRALATELLEKGKVLHRLLKQDDWSFVIKAHALLEAAVTQLVIARVGNQSLASFIERLPLGGQFGKIRLCEQLQLLSDDQRRFIRWFSEFRNPLVHRLENVTFTFKKHVRSFNKDQENSWLNSIVWFSNDDVPTKEKWRSITMHQPKTSLYMGLYLVVGECIIQTHDSKTKQAINETSEATMKKLHPHANVGRYKGSKVLAQVKKILETAMETEPVVRGVLPAKSRQKISGDRSA